MEHLKSYYTIEKHLEETAKANQKFEILDAIWKLNKRNLSSALANVSQYFPHYSLHEESHSNTIINNIESFLGEERIKRLSPTNSWLILMASFTHDLGMVVFQDLVEKEWLSENFQTFLKELSEWEDDEIQNSASTLIKFQNLTKDEEVKDTEWISGLTPLDIRNSVTLIVSEYIRRIHHERSEEIIKGSDETFFKIANSFYADQIPSRLLNVLAKVSYLHGVEFYEILNKLEFESNGISNDKINPRLIACLLRLGDLLDVDDRRFNLFTEQVFNFPKSSRRHLEKHSSIRHLLITPEAIEITSDCPSEEVYRLSRDWFDWLEQEVQNQSREWSNIAPYDLGGSSPTIPKGKIKVYYNNTVTNDDLLNLRFSISNKKMFEILEGGSIYENAEFTFIRELVQNALDASKIQLWKEIENGTFDFVFRSHFDQHNLSHEEIIKKIKFPSDIPALLYNSFGVKLSLKWSNNAKDKLMLVVEDQGTGISNPDLIRMTSKVGESQKKDKNYRKFLDRIPFWLKPTGAFGVGLQSVFIITDSFKIHTKSEGEESKEIKFRSAKKGKYSSIASTKPDMNRGTKVFVEIPEEKFPEIFGNTFDSWIVMDYDYFTDEHQSIFIPKIEKYIRQTLEKIESLKIDFFEKKFNLNQPISELDDNKRIKLETDKIQIYATVIDDDLIFKCYENEIGSEYYLNFKTSDIRNEHKDSFLHSADYYVRDIPIKERAPQYYKLWYCFFEWNFMSPESDKILNLSREKLIRKNYRPLSSQFLKDILPKSLELIEELIIRNKEEIISNFKSEERAAFGYFKFLLTSRVNEIDLTHNLDKEFLQEFHLNPNLASYTNSKKISYQKFLSSDTFIIPEVKRGGKNNREIFEKKEELISNSFEDAEIRNIPIIWNPNFFSPFLMFEFESKELRFIDDNLIYTISNKPSSTDIKSGLDTYLSRFLKRTSGAKRVWNYSSKEFEEILSVNNTIPTGFERLPPYTNKFIISPFKDLDEFKALKDKIQVFSNEEELSTFLTDEVISDLVPESLIEWIIDNKPKDINTERSRILILQKYRQLIIDILMINS